ncbi:MAG: NUDIX hydrolase [Planctomycetes bacterium]|nr:NUDIX hydrolase [Planctomycetota bacterium]
MQTTRILQGDVFGVDRVRFTSPGGEELTRLIVRHPGAVTVIPRLEDGSLVLIRNFRVSVERWLVEFCAGKLESGEAPESCAARELEEETGWSAARIRPLGTFLTTPGFSDEWMHVFAAEGLTPVDRRLQPGERIEVLRARPEQVDAWIADGTLQDGKSIAAWAIWKARA